VAQARHGEDQGGEEEAARNRLFEFLAEIRSAFHTFFEALRAVARPRRVYQEHLLTAYDARPRASGSGSISWRKLATAKTKEEIAELERWDREERVSKLNRLKRTRLLTDCERRELEFLENFDEAVAQAEAERA
jgi:hypothetical protein